MLTYSDVPKDYAQNLLWRKFLWDKLINGTPEGKVVIIAACKADVLFYVNSFVWTNDPRKKDSCLPFITYEFQDRYLRKLESNYHRSQETGQRGDVLTLKSRTLGATWCVIAFIDHCFRFETDKQYLEMSRTEDEVDSKDNPATLFAKHDFIEDRLPAALQIPGREHTHLKLINPRNRTVVEGESSNENAGRSGRYALAFRDEEAFQSNGERISRALGETTLMQLRQSTPNGTTNSFYNAYTKGALDIVEMHWSEHPDKRRGLYSIEGGKVAVIDRDWHRTHPGYEFCLLPTAADPGSKWDFLRSPWFDEVFRSADSLKDVAQEHQLSFLNSGALFFRAEKLAYIREKNCREPLEQGEISAFIELDAGFEDDDVRPNRFRLWCALDAGGRPPQDATYSLGADIAAGSGASDSTISVLNDTTKEKVCEFYSNCLTPERFAHVAVAVAKFFTTPKSKAFIGWDMGGPGIPFGLTVAALNYGYSYYYGQENGQEAKARKSPGVPSNQKIKLEMFEKYRSALLSGWYVSHSDLTYSQAAEFSYDGNGGVVHKPGTRSDDDLSDRGAQHGDIVTGEVIMWLVAESRPAPEPEVAEVPRFCHRARMQAREAVLAAAAGEMAWRK